MDIDIDRIRELVAIVRDARISELTIRQADSRITIRKPLPQLLEATVETVPAASPRGDEISAPVTPAAEAGSLKQYVTVASPVVGTLHLSEGDSQEASVRVGQKVSAGDVVCVVESMKLIHEVYAPASGTVVQILAEDDQPVEFGEELMLIEASDV